MKWWCWRDDIPRDVVLFTLPGGLQLADNWNPCLQDRHCVSAEKQILCFGFLGSMRLALRKQTFLDSASIHHKVPGFWNLCLQGGAYFHGRRPWRALGLFVAPFICCWKPFPSNYPNRGETRRKQHWKHFVLEWPRIRLVEATASETIFVPDSHETLAIVVSLVENEWCCAFQWQLLDITIWEVTEDIHCLQFMPCRKTKLHRTFDQQQAFRSSRTF